MEFLFRVLSTFRPDSTSLEDLQKKFFDKILEVILVKM